MTAMQLEQRGSIVVREALLVVSLADWFTEHLILLRLTHLLLVGAEHAALRRDRRLLLNLMLLEVLEVRLTPGRLLLLFELHLLLEVRTRAATRRRLTHYLHARIAQLSGTESR